jgi:SAM-dependent methyltransferase
MNYPKTPIANTPSSLFSRFAKEIAINSNEPILDVACGYGRNAIYLSSFGVDVICLDNNEDALSYIKSYYPKALTRTEGLGNISTLKIDLVDDPWPYREESIGAIINVYFFLPKLFEQFLVSLKIGGYIFIESIDGHGGNYIELPPQGFVKGKLSRAFEILYFKEKKVGPPSSDASTIKLFAKKTMSYDVV